MKNDLEKFLSGDVCVRITTEKQSKFAIQMCEKYHIDTSSIYTKSYESAPYYYLNDDSELQCVEHCWFWKKAEFNDVFGLAYQRSLVEKVLHIHLIENLSMQEINDVLGTSYSFDRTEEISNLLEISLQLKSNEELSDLYNKYVTDGELNLSAGATAEINTGQSVTYTKRKGR